MKRISISILILGACLASVAWAQQPPGMPGRHLQKSFATMNPSTTAQADPAHTVKVYDLGHYPGGTWAEPRDINNLGVVVGLGDISSGYIRPIGVPVFGPDAGQWFDLGTLGGDRTDTEVMAMAVADTGMIVGHSAITGNQIVHAFAWTPQSGMVDIGTLADIGYSSYNFSLAYGTNKAGTLIVGWSSTEFPMPLGGPEGLPVVWTPQIVWKWGRPVTTWKIHKLDVGDLSSATDWAAIFANDFGQIIGTATAADGVQIAVLWNPLPDGKGWKIMQLPVSPDYPNALLSPGDINDRGEIVGTVGAPDWSTYFPALWEPVGPSRSAYKLTLLTSLTGSQTGWAEASGINNRGDIVGVSSVNYSFR